MDAKPRRAFTPDYAVPPGDTLLEVLDSLGLTQIELAERTGRPKKTINEIINGRAAITPETALQFERVLDVEASFWTSLESQYRAALAARAERDRLIQQVSWLEQFPIKAMIKAGWIEAKTSLVEQLQVVLTFFGVASVDSWDEVWRDYHRAVAFRESPSFESDFGATTAWLRRSEIEGRTIKTTPYDATSFRGALGEVRALTSKDPSVFCPAMIELCARAGVAVVFVPELPHLTVCGATRWLSSDKALIALTLRYKRDDHLWFTFFHEAGHILLHGKRAVFVEEDLRKGAKSVAHNSEDLASLEEEANRFSRDFLIPPTSYAAFLQRESLTEDSIRSFAREIGIAPGIVVGRLQYEKEIPYPTKLNRLKRSFAWAE